MSTPTGSASTRVWWTQGWEGASSQAGSLARNPRRAIPTQSKSRAMPIRISRRHIQIALGLLWVLDGALQLQPYMYTKGFLTEIIGPTISGQPSAIASSMTWVVHLAGHHLVLFNTLFALIQVAVGVGLLVPRTVKPALAASFAWGLGVWWFGEGFGQLLTGTSPLTGAPGAVILYVLIGALVWPTERPAGPSAVASGPFGELGGKVVWVVIWLGMTALWLLPENRSADGIHSDLSGVASATGGGLGGFIGAVGRDTTGKGTAIAIALAVASAVIGVGVLTRHRVDVLGGGAVISLAYWVLGQAFGGVTTGRATDPNAGLLFVLLALALFPATVEVHPATRWLCERATSNRLSESPEASQPVALDNIA